ncbi:hypothetical protein MGYG_07997 [Nannizzia gypsea CBS 118893]|uniref:Uncharacterized protein n=1 Tax=Arthroderma gypseum (strain ATCC MYA-4604 / CBS 118893) TaxID=535722 RepID=E4V4S0_ARTGP|nr:hypothetical protein MGYG_07997 [Nannizzia gypsea CBS 118893]EFR04994.1 hypothetical protein MGYG_07997 [Nannizzia gypsea CBS 118893]
MAGLTCQTQASDGGISEDDAISSPFIYIPKTQKKQNTSSKEDYITSFLFEDQRPFGASAGDEASYFPPFQVTELDTQTVTDLALPGRTYTATGSPVSTFSMSSADDEDIPEVQSLIKPSATTSTCTATSTYKPSDAGSRASSFSIERRRTSRGQASSSSRSTSSTRPRRSMQHLRGRSGTGTGTYVKYTSSRSDTSSSSQRNERDLITLHRESCLLFSQTGPYKELSSSPTDRNPLSARHANSHASTAPARRPSFQHTQHSASASPLLRPENTPTSPFQSDGIPSPPINQSTWNPLNDETINISSSPPPLPKTVIDWTSPSTRRREYEKIDRASRGIRGAWRKFAPQWCQSKDARAPFFEECKAGHAKDDGSVRRFRMDIPEEEDADTVADQPSRPGLGVLRNGLVSALTRLKSENEAVQPVNEKENSAPIPIKSWRPFVSRRNSSFV